MKVISLILVIICCGLALGALDDVELLKKFEAYILHHGKSFSSDKDKAARFITYKKNLKEINEHNKQKQNTYQMEENFFTDMDLDEIKKSYMGFIVNKNDNKKSSNVAQKSAQARVIANLPSSKDWRQTGAITQVKNQGSCGSCWAFAATGALEAYYYLKNKASVILSEQHLVNCGLNGCNGGDATTAFYYATQVGIPLESNCPYVGIKQTCSSIKGTIIKGIDYEELPPGDEARMKEVVATNGPVAVAIEANANFMNYKSGVYVDSSCGTSANHAMLVVGYGNENGQAFWLVKNSWGTGWGDNGYIKMARDKGNQCEIASHVSYPIL